MNFRVDDTVKSSKTKNEIRKEKKSLQKEKRISKKYTKV